MQRAEVHVIAPHHHPGHGEAFRARGNYGKLAVGCARRFVGGSLHVLAAYVHRRIHVGYQADAPATGLPLASYSDAIFSIFAKHGGIGHLAGRDVVAGRVKDLDGFVIYCARGAFSA